jgi:L-asparaginase II
MADHQHAPTEASSANPVLIEAVRGDAVESIHRGSFAIVDAHGRVIMAAGDTDTPVFPRSGIKPIQALALIETGAAKAFGLGHANIALACASHNGEVTHTDIIGNWLQKIGCTPDDLVCGPSLPWTDEAKAELIKNGTEPSTLHDNCSGKHTGFLTIAKHLGHPIQGYSRGDHPVQQRVIGIIEQMTGMDLFDASKGMDGCGIPTIAVPLGNLALAMARLGDPHDQPEERQKACARIRNAMAMEPYLIAGKGRFCTRVVDALGQTALVKTGAEGVYCATLTELGLGVAIKVDDGARRAAEAVMMRLLMKLNVLTDRAMGKLLNLLEPPIFSRSGEVIGVLRAAHPDLV